MTLTPEQSKAVVEALQQHDFTTSISLAISDSSGDDANHKTHAHTLVLEKNMKECMQNALSELGIKRHMGHFSEDHPVNLLMNADAKYIAKEAEKILADQEKTVAAVHEFGERFGPILETAGASYCKATGKTIDDLDEEDALIIMDHVATIVDQELLSVVMQGQQIQKLFEIAREHQSHEDFHEKSNWDSRNFQNQWTHSRTEVGQTLSLDDEEAPIVVAAPGENPDMQLLRDSFLTTLSDADAAIFHMREIGYTQGEIAEKLGYKNHSAVTKRLGKIKERWDAYMGEVTPNERA